MTKKDETEGRPPFFKSWKEMYLVVLANLAVTILIFYLLTILLR